MSNNQKVVLGLWTPWAKVLCYECHGDKFDRHRSGVNGFEPYVHTMPKEEWVECTTPIEIQEGKAVTFCDQCGKDVQVGDSVAAEHNLVRDLRKHGLKAEMWQTGGMCSACAVIRTTDVEWEYEGPHYLITYDWDGDGKFWIGAYDGNGDCEEDLGWDFKTYEEVVAHMLTLTDIEKIEVKN